MSPCKTPVETVLQNLRNSLPACAMPQFPLHVGCNGLRTLPSGASFAAAAAAAAAAKGRNLSSIFFCILCIFSCVLCICGSIGNDLDLLLRLPFLCLLASLILRSLCFLLVLLLNHRCAHRVVEVAVPRLNLVGTDKLSRRQSLLQLHSKGGFERGVVQRSQVALFLESGCTRQLLRLSFTMCNPLLWQRLPTRRRCKAASSFGSNPSEGGSAHSC
mmetsp:Transcript_11411/g.25152  ORF Transcript_11411/g.25152 Transcript_11411/m.25152 type:complete len:216 (+) Transcript_11411:418-1065(+)